jgi:CspA family cold shock protein
MATGVIANIKQDKGFAFIKPDDGSKDVFMHHSAIVEGEGNFDSLENGAQVSYEIVADPKGPRAENVRVI